MENEPNQLELSTAAKLRRDLKIFCFDFTDYLEDQKIKLNQYIRHLWENKEVKAEYICSRIEEKAKAVAQITTQKVQTHPYQALGIACVTGFVIGSFIYGRAHRK